MSPVVVATIPYGNETCLIFVTSPFTTLLIYVFVESDCEYP